MKKSGGEDMLQGLKALTIATGLMAVVGGATSAVAQELPSYYPSDYNTLLEASKQEKELLIYTNLSPEIWEKINEGLAKRYPWITVKTVDLGTELFDRLQAEQASNTRTADLVVTSASENWKEFRDAGFILDYKSPESDKLPDWAKPHPGLYAITADPMVMIYNKFLIPEAEAPKSVHDVAALVEKHPELKDKITTYSVAVPYGQALHWAWVKKNPDAKDVLAKLGPIVRPERSAGPMFEKVGTGEYAAAYFISSATAFQRLKDPARASVVGWNFIADGNPVVLRGVGIPKSSANINSAKVMLDFLVSVDGQIALGQGGVTPYREEVTKDQVANYTYRSIADAVGGDDNVLIVGFDKEYLAEPTFIDEMKALYLQAK
jgi:iron(III) transport system substrate-binding protein